MQNLSRIPVCSQCLALPEPLQAGYFCQTCRTPFLSEQSLDQRGLCPACQSGLGNFDAAYSYGNYGGALQQLIHLFKYGKVESLADPLTRLLASAIPLEAQFDVVLAMPMHWRKKWARGFNQAELLAFPLAQRYGLKLSTNLRRSRYTKAQAGLSEAARQENLKDSFRITRPAQIAGKRILLVDDVFTTGAAVRAATAALKAAGSGPVTCLTLARVDRPAPRSASGSLGALNVAVTQAKHRSAVQPARVPPRVAALGVPAGSGVVDD